MVERSEERVQAANQPSYLNDMELAAHRPAESLDRRRKVAVWGSLFWLSTYAIFSMRGRLFVETPLPWIDYERLVAVSVGTVTYGLAIVTLDRFAAAPPVRRLAAALVVAGVSVGLLLPLRLALGDGDWSDATSMSSELRWLITWLGYFLAWTACYAAATPAGVPDPETGAPAGPDADCIWAQRGQQRVRLPVAAIEYVEAEGNYACIHAGDEHGLVRIPLAQLGRRLGPDFLRIHRSVICRRSAIRTVERTASGAFRATLDSSAVVPVGRRIGGPLIDEVRSSLDAARCSNDIRHSPTTSSTKLS